MSADGLTGNPVAVRPAPLRPVIGLHARTAQANPQCSPKNQADFHHPSVARGGRKSTTSTDGMLVENGDAFVTRIETINRNLRGDFKTPELPQKGTKKSPENRFLPTLWLPRMLSLA
jgi:hypothetical protein